MVANLPFKLQALGTVKPGYQKIIADIFETDIIIGWGDQFVAFFEYKSLSSFSDSLSFFEFSSIFFRQ